MPTENTLGPFGGAPSVQQRRTPVLGVVGDGELPGTWVDVLPARDVGLHVGVMTIGIGTASEQLCARMAGLRVDPPHTPALASPVPFRRQPLAGRGVAL